MSCLKKKKNERTEEKRKGSKEGENLCQDHENNLFFLYFRLYV